MPDNTQQPAEPAKIQRRVHAIRGDLGQLVGELERRGRNAGRPLVIGGAAVAVAGISGLILWRVLRPKPTQLERLAKAIRRAAAHPDRVAEETPSVGKKILAAAASAAASVLARRLAQRLSARSAH